MEPHLLHFVWKRTMKNYFEWTYISNLLKEDFAYILRLMRFRITTIFGTILILSFLHAGSKWEIISSTSNQFVLKIDTEFENDDDIKPYTLLIGLPTKELPQLDIIRSNNVSIQNAISDSISNDIMWVNNQLLQGLYTGSLQISPLASRDSYSENIVITITYSVPIQDAHQPSEKQKRFLENRITNWDIAKRWTQSPAPKRVSRSVDLPDGEWLNFTVTEDGIYKLSGQTILNELTNSTNIDINSLRLYTHSSAGRERMRDFLDRFSPNTIYQEVPENLVECAIEIKDDDNSILDVNDEILFYGRGAEGFDYNGNDISFKNNVYFSENNYWLLIPTSSSENGLRVETYDDVVVNPVLFNYGKNYQHIEYDATNPDQSGLLWVGTTIPKNSVYALNFESPDVITSLQGELTLSFRGNYSASVSSSPSHILSLYKQNTSNDPDTTFSIAGKTISTKSFDIDLIDHSNNNISFLIKNVSSNQASAPYFDYASFSYSQELNYSNKSLHFYRPNDSGPIQLAISSNSTPKIWDVTNSFTPISHTKKQNGTIEYNSSSNTSNEFIIFLESDAVEISQLTNVGVSPLNTLRNTREGVKHIIIGPESFRQAAEPLRQYRNHEYGSIYASIETIYNEFSGGNTDPFAIHSFLQWTQEYWQGIIPEYVLILGDADYDYKNITGKSKTIVPTIEVGTGGNSHCTDDRYASINGKIPELAIGRYPAHSINDVINFVEKIVEFESNPEFGMWRQHLTLVADDGARPYETNVALEKSHTNNSETVAALVHPAVQVNKLYTIEYPEVNDASTFGVVKPDATEAILNTLEQGTAIINYIGHGSPAQWAQERLLTQDRDLGLINTSMRLPLWIAGTCSWGHFDDVDTEAFSEDIIRLPMNGACGIITTTRAISFSSNQNYITRIFQSIFPNHLVTEYPIGHILQSAKLGDKSGEYFQLMGDPATPLSIPYRSFEINNISPDTLFTLDTALVSGSIPFTSSGGNGIIQLNDTEKSVTRHYYYKSDEQTISYTLPGGTLFRGQFTFDTNQFSARLRIPNDFSYSTDPGKISMYIATNDDPPLEALGYYDNVLIRGGDIAQDDEGPIIKFYNRDYLPLYSGDHIPSNSSLLIQLTDPLGINVTGQIGHEIVVTDNTTGKETNITDRFIYNPNSITTGTISYRPEQTLEEIQLLVKAWDSANNPSETSIILELVEEKDLSLYQIYNYPNPFATDTQFTFEITTTAEVGIKIFTLNGRNIASIEPEFFEAGYHYIIWDGIDEFGDNIANGAYLYQVTAKADNKTVSYVNTCAKFR